MFNNPYAAAPAPVQPMQTMQPMAQPMQPMQQMQTMQQMQQPMQQPIQTMQTHHGMTQVPQPAYASQQAMYQEPIQQNYAPVQQQGYSPATVAPVQASNDVQTQIQSYLVSAGINADQVKSEVIANGGQVSPQTYQTLVAKHGEATANLLANNIQALHQQATQANQTVVQARYDFMEKSGVGVAGQSGEQTFNELVQWLQQPDPQGNARLTKQDMKDLNKMLSAGGKQQQLAMEHMVAVYQKEAGQTQPMGVGAIFGNNQSGGSTTGYIDALSYSTEYDKIYRTEGANSPKLAALDNRRSQSIAMERNRQSF